LSFNIADFNKSTDHRPIMGCLRSSQQDHFDIYHSQNPNPASLTQGGTSFLCVFQKLGTMCLIGIYRDHFLLRREQCAQLFLFLFAVVCLTIDRPHNTWSLVQASKIFRYFRNLRDLLPLLHFPATHFRVFCFSATVFRVLILRDFISVFYLPSPVVADSHRQ
jgi:hypothetical protein